MFALPISRERLTDVGKHMILLGGILAVGWFAIFLYTVVAFLNAPLQPDAASGNVVPFSDHGIIHYVTNFESQVHAAVWIAGPIIAILEFVGFALYRGTTDMFRRM